MKKRAVAYCRVSTDREDQINSLENQKQHWEEHIRNCPDMEFFGLYVDEGITGTSTIKRDGFNRMIRDAEQGKFDLILTKEVSRFGRNIVDVLKFTRLLKEKKVGVFFESDSIDTLDNDGELRLSIMATLAQEESRKTSQRVQWGHRQAMKNGIVFGADRILGYNLVNKTLEINEQEAKIVEKIYFWYLEGDSLHGIAYKLNDMGIKGRLGGCFNHTSVRSILTNEKYCGDLIQGKYYTEDYLSHKQIKNKGERDLLILRDNHPAIIDRVSWNEVQSKMAERNGKYRTEGLGYSRHIWGGKIVCGCCGSKYRRKVYRTKDGRCIYAWLCTAYNDKGLKACINSGYLREDLLEFIIIDILGIVVTDDIKQTLIFNFSSSLSKALNNTNITDECNKIKKMIVQLQNKKKRLLDLYVTEKSSLSKKDFNIKNDELSKLEESLVQTVNKILSSNILVKSTRVEELKQVIKDKFDFNVFNNDLFENFLKKIIVNHNSLHITLLGVDYIADLNKYPKRVNR